MAADFMCGSGAGWLAPWLGSALRDPPPPLTLSPHDHILSGKRKKKKKEALFTGKHSRPLVV